MGDRYIVYGRNNCKFCREAVSLLSSMDKEHYFVDLEEEPGTLNEAKEFYKRETVPIVIKNNEFTGKTQMIGGFDDLSLFLEREKSE